MQSGTVAHRHPAGVAAGLAALTLAAVFGVVLDAVPGGTLPADPAVVHAVPHVNAAISVVAVATITRGWRAIRRGEVRAHRRAMLASLGLFVLFLVLYLYKVAVAGPTEFAGPDAVYRLVYLPLLAIHVTLAIADLPVLYYVAILGLTRSQAAIADSPHPRVGRIAAALWLVSFVLGVAVYLLLYHVYPA
ncbi:MAG: DUF420 domain-containing protein [Halobacteriaceae archaeon]